MQRRKLVRKPERSQGSAELGGSVWVVAIAPGPLGEKRCVVEDGATLGTGHTATPGERGWRQRWLELLEPAAECPVT